MSGIDDANGRRRQRARTAERDTFRYVAEEDWPACVACGAPIRRSAPNPPGIGLYRVCDCVGIVWRSEHIVGSGWQRITVDP